MSDKKRKIDRGDGENWYVYDDEDSSKVKMTNVEDADMSDIEELLGRRGKKVK